MSTTLQESTILNGWKVEEMQEAVSEVQAQPEAGKLTWRSRAVWDAGFGLDVRTESIEQLGQTLPRAFTLRGDHPPELLGANTGPTAIETLLAALASCVAGTFAAQATARGVALDGLELEIQGAIDLNGFFGLQPIPPGVSDVELTLKVDSAADDEMLREILDATRQLSPVYDSITRPIEVRCRIERSAA